MADKDIVKENLEVESAGVKKSAIA